MALAGKPTMLPDIRGGDLTNGTKDVPAPHKTVVEILEDFKKYYNNLMNNTVPDEEDDEED